MSHQVSYIGTFGGQTLEAEMTQNGHNVNFRVTWGGITVEDSSCTSDCWNFETARHLSGVAALASEQKQLREHAETACFNALRCWHEELSQA